MAQEFKEKAHLNVDRERLGEGLNRVYACNHRFLNSEEGRKCIKCGDFEMDETCKREYTKVSIEFVGENGSIDSLIKKLEKMCTNRNIKLNVGVLYESNEGEHKDEANL